VANIIDMAGNVITDENGDIVTAGDIVDMGAFEFQGGIGAGGAYSFLLTHQFMLDPWG
jgi:hypothetical protein